MTEDHKKDSNTQLSILFKELEHIREERGQLPSRIAIMADNTARELRNQKVLLSLSTLLSRHGCRSVEMLHHRVGHTHNAVDQRFSTMAGLLSAADELQTPEDHQLHALVSEFMIMKELGYEILIYIYAHRVLLRIGP